MSGDHTCGRMISDPLKEWTLWWWRSSHPRSVSPSQGEIENSPLHSWLLWGDRGKYLVFLSRVPSRWVPHGVCGKYLKMLQFHKVFVKTSNRIRQSLGMSMYVIHFNTHKKCTKLSVLGTRKQQKWTKGKHKPRALIADLGGCLIDRALVIFMSTNSTIEVIWKLLWSAQAYF